MGSGRAVPDLGAAATALVTALREGANAPSLYSQTLSLCREFVSSEDWDQFESVGISGESRRLRSWINRIFTLEPPPSSIDAILFGISDGYSGGVLLTDLELSGWSGFPEPDAVLNRSWWPASGRAESECFAQIARLTPVLGEEVRRVASYLLPLAVALGSVKDALDGVSYDLVLGGAPERGIAVGFVEGDMLLLGVISNEGLRQTHVDWI
jgi:hypothetical protein